MCSWFVYFVRVGGCTWWVYFGVLWLLNLVYLLARFGILAAWIWCIYLGYLVYLVARVWYTSELASPRRNNEENGATKYPTNKMDLPGIRKETNNEENEAAKYPDIP